MNECPYCHRKAKKAASSNWFPIHKCKKCGTKYCEENGPPCPKCGDRAYVTVDKVYA